MISGVFGNRHLIANTSKMGDAGAFANPRNRVRPPDKGSFPLDHMGVCKDMREKWMACMKAHAWDSGECRSESAAYLRCRMANNLMSPEEVTKLGFNDAEWNQAGLIYSEK
ncbi:Cytochrome c oxidase assembly protein COX19 [Taenia crassiceps]|uniref:Cytochrome c oxidase assembly protein COX19 n=1 Tax=Taenia crassiceps TaxID=6207 RepID=A0ABR4QK08_9CEST